MSNSPLRKVQRVIRDRKQARRWAKVPVPLRVCSKEQLQNLARARKL